MYMQIRSNPLQCASKPPREVDRLNAHRSSLSQCAFSVDGTSSHGSVWGLSPGLLPARPLPSLVGHSTLPGCRAVTSAWSSTLPPVLPMIHSHCLLPRPSCLFLSPLCQIKMSGGPVTHFHWVQHLETLTTNGCSHIPTDGVGLTLMMATSSPPPTYVLPHSPCPPHPIAMTLRYDPSILPPPSP